MAKGKGVVEKTKTTFGVRKKGKGRKTRNKHDRSEKKYRGQGR